MPNNSLARRLEALEKLEAASDQARQLLLPHAEAVPIIGHAQWGKYAQNSFVVGKAIAAWQAQTGEAIDTPIALLEWLDTTWRAWTDESEEDACPA